MFDTRVRQEKSEIEFVTKSLGKVSVDRETNSFPRTGKPRREVGFIPAPLDSRRYSESTTARQRVNIVLRAAVKAESRTMMMMKKKKKLAKPRRLFISPSFFFPSFPRSKSTTLRQG